MIIDLHLIYQYLPDLLRGFGVSLQIAALGSLIGIIQGTALAILQTSTIRFFNILVMIFVTIIRGTPMLIQILCAFYLLPQLGINIDAFWMAIIAIGCNSSAYISQIIRSGIQAVNKGQIEAAHVLGLTKIQTMRYIILPQAIAVVIPALGNEFVTLIKDSSLASIIGVSELTKEGRLIISRTYDAISIFTAIALLYLIITSAVSFFIYKLEQRMHRHVKN